MAGLAARAGELGIQPEHIDGRGRLCRVDAAVLERLVAALEAGQSEPSRLPPVLIWRIGRTRHLDFAPLIGGTPLGPGQWQISAGASVIASGTHNGKIFAPEQLPPPGVYRLSVTGEGGAANEITVPLIVCPQIVYQGGEAADKPLWVLAVQLYGVRSHHNWGCGDFSDLRDLLRICADLGAAGVGLNPLHALFDDRPEQASPYAPNSRHFLNLLYIDPDAIPEFPGRDAAGLGEELERLRGCAEIDYRGVAAAKTVALRLAFDEFRRRSDPARQADFNAFRRERSPHLDRFAAFEVLRRRFQTVWWDWPEPWRQPTDDAIASLQAEAGDEIAYIEFVQWIADRQLAACRDEARALGLPVGLYTDLAVGVEPGGADAWSRQDSILRQVEVGAPPDVLNVAGQAWGLAAFNPRALEAQGFAPFRELLADNMRYAGAMRLDHVLGLNRLYLIPSGASPRDGAYIRYPLEPMLAVAAVESERCRCIVIGEDLGTVPDELRTVLADWGVWSYLVMMFERDETGVFKPPEAYKLNALATFSTHDLPTFAGWHSGHDLAVKRSIGLDPGETDEERQRALWLAGEALAACGVVKDRAWNYVDVARFLARTPSRLVAISIEDLLGVADQPNVPGTMHEHPNWRQRLPIGIEALAQHPDVVAVATALREEGRSFRTP